MRRILAQPPRRACCASSPAARVDDGKTTLIGRLLYDTKLIFEDQLARRRERQPSSAARTGENIDFALLVDGLEAEREQGITIDVAYRYFSTPTSASSSSPTRPATSSTRATWRPAPRPPMSPSS